jgi:hypothetical protein
MSSSSGHQAKADPELVRQLAEAPDDDTVEVVFVLDSTDGVLLGDAVEEQVRNLVQRVESEMGSSVAELNIFPNLASFVVRASPQIVEHILEQPEVATAVANQQPGSAALS